MYALSWKLLNIGLLSEYFVTLLKRLYLQKMAAKCSTFLHKLYSFLMGRSRIFFGMRMKFHLGRTKRRSKREVWGKKPKMSIIFAKFSLLSKIQTLSHKLVVRHTSHEHHCNQHAQTPIRKHFPVISTSSSWSK